MTTKGSGGCVRRSVLAALGLLGVLGVLALAGGCKTLLVGKGLPNYGGDLRGLPVHRPVRVVRDTYGIPHIYAQDRHDLLVAQGFVHAQDRLWQMETYRRLVDGRLAEVAGEARLDLDICARLLGFPEMRRRSAAAVSPEETELVQAYVDGINAYLRLRADDLPLEFRSAGVTPAPWTVEDVFSFVVLNSWNARENYRGELMTIAARKTVALEEWKDIFPSHRGAMLPDDAYFESLRDLKIGPLNKAAHAFFEALPVDVPSAGGGSNMWTVASGPGGKPILANDTHLGISVPGTWYLCHLNAPGIDLAGASAPGVPSVVIGRAPTVAWGMTILPIDNVDLYVVKLDPKDRSRYYVGDQLQQMDKEEMVIPIKGGATRSFTAWRTIYGPLITVPQSGDEAAVAVRWYASVPEAELTDLTMRTILRFLDCRSAADVMDAIRYTKYVGLNFMAADTNGNIAWHATGAVPIRRGYSGRLPADGSSGTMGWDGFYDYEQLPGSVNPAGGILANSNNRVVTDTDPYRWEGNWSAPYRYERTLDLLQGLKEPTVEDSRAMQLDVHSLQADEILPKLLAYSFEDPRAREAARILGEWDHEIRADSVGACVYEVLLTEWVHALLDDEIGKDLFYYFHVGLKKYLVQDVILDRPESTLWDRKDTPEREGPREILESALSATMRTLEKELGPNRGRWSWGRIHGIEWRHAGGTTPFKKMLLNVGPFPIGGDGTTLNSNAPIPARGEYRPIIIPVLRMVVPLADPDGMKIIAPMGQSGQPAHRHYDDLVRPWLEGKLVTLPLSLERVEAAKAAEMTLNP